VDDKSPELIEHEMEATRRSLTEKVSALEDKVAGNIESATTAVQETVESVKSAVQETVAAVKETVVGVKETVADSVTSVSEGVMHTFDVRSQVSNNPWLMVGGAAVAGFVTGYVAFGGRRTGLFSAPMFHHMSYSSAGEQGAPPPRPRPADPEPSTSPSPSRTPGWLDELMAMAGNEAKKLGQQALMAVVESAQRNITEGLPKLIDNALQMPDRKDATDRSRQPANGAGRYSV